MKSFFIVLFLFPFVVLSQINTVCFSIDPNPNPNDLALSGFTKYINVLGVVHVFAESNVSDDKILHVAAITAELLDNNEDGIIDDQALELELSSKYVVMPVFAYKGSPSENMFFNNFGGSNNCAGAVLYNDEVDPNNPVNWNYEATLEEVLHTINSCGHLDVYPLIFGLQPNSSVMSDAMDIARGGQFLNPPWINYPSTAWYTYDDYTCDYECMGMEYLYWCIASNIGAISNVCNQIDNEWDLCTPILFQSVDTVMYNIITDPQYKLPQFLPDGNYCPIVSYLEETYSIKNLVSVVNILGETTNLKHNTILFYIYDDGTVKKIFNLY